MIHRKLSRGCRRCRRMKKKCDQKLPSCLRCERVGVTCSGYQDEAEIIFKDQSNKTRIRVENAKKKVENLTRVSKSQSQPQLQSLDLVPADRQIELFKTPSQTARWDSEGSLFVTHPSTSLVSDSYFINSNYNNLKCFFFNQYVLPAQISGWPGWLQLLPSMYASAPDNSGLKPAVLAVSSAVFAGRERNPTYLRQSIQLYTQSLQAVRQALRLKDYGNLTLMSVSLLDTFQHIVGEDSGSWGLHAKGMKALLHLKQKENSQPEDLIQLSVMPYTSDLHWELQNRQRPSESSQKWVTSFKHPWSHKWPSERVLVILLQFADVVGKATNLHTLICDNRDRNEAAVRTQCAQLVALILEAQELDKSTIQWSQGLKGAELRNKAQNRFRGRYSSLEPGYMEFRWSVRKKSNLPNDRSIIDSPIELIYYHDIWVARVWNSYRIARIILHDTILISLSLLDPSSPSHTSLFSWSKDIIAASFQEIRESVPFLLGQVDENGTWRRRSEPTALGCESLIWPLEVSVGIKSLTQSQREWAQHMLVEVVTVAGMTRALASCKIK